MRKLLVKLGASLCIFAGLATLWLPIPTGLILIVVGLALLLTTSPQVVGWLRSLRHRYPSLDRRLHLVEPHLPEKLRRAFASSRARRWRRKRTARPCG